MKYITENLWEHVENSETKISKRVYNQLNKDILSVILDRDIFWFEKTWSGAYIPEYVYQYAIKVYKKLGYKYLYDIKTN